jgi:hypothetical protein
MLHQFTDGAFESDDERLATTVATARISVVLDRLGISMIDVHMPGGSTTIRLRFLPGSSTQMEDCTVIRTSCRAWWCAHTRCEGAIVMATVALFVLLMPRQPPPRVHPQGKGVTDELLSVDEGG